MPNQLLSSKRRQSLAESTVVLDALAEIARLEKTTVSDLIRDVLRDVVRHHATNPKRAQRLRRIAHNLTPKPPADFRSPAQVARFKRAQREHDRLLLDLGLAAPAEVQAKNSLTRSSTSIEVLNFATAHA